MVVDLPKLLKSKTPKIYKNKKLNNANFGNFNLNDYQVFLHLITKIGGVDEYGKYMQQENLNREYVLTAKEFSEVFNADLSNSYKLLYKACKKLMKTSITLEKIELKEIWEINICSMAKYNKNNGSIFIKFTDDIMPYLAQVRKRFVLYNIKEISNFGSLYTTRLYELIQEFKETGWLIKSVDELRNIFAVGKKFRTYNNFKQRTFAHACKEINDNYEYMNLSFEELKEKRKVTDIKFTFRPIEVNEVINHKTGQKSKVYTKPKPQQSSKNKKKKEPGLSKLSDVLDNQLSFLDIKQKHQSKISAFISKIKSVTKITKNKS